MAEGSDGSGSEMGIEFGGGRDEDWSTVKSNNSRRKRQKQI